MARLDVIPAALLDAGRVLRSASQSTAFAMQADAGVGERIALSHRELAQRLIRSGISETLASLADNVERAAEAYVATDGSIQRRSNGRGD